MEPLVEIPETQLKTTEDLKKRDNVIRVRATELAKRAGGLDGQKDELENLSKAVAKLAQGMTEIEGTVKAGGRSLTSDGGAPGELSMRLEPPKGMDRSHFNLLALSTDELGYAAEYGTPNLRAFSPVLAHRPRKSIISPEWDQKHAEVNALNSAVLLCDHLFA